MRVHSTPTACLAALLLLAAAGAAPALARSSGGSHGGGSHGGSSHGSGGNHGGGHPSGGNHSGGGNHGNSGFHGGNGFHGGGFHGGFHDGFHGGFGFHDGFHGGFRGGFGYYYPSFWGSLFIGYPFPYWYYGPWGYYGYGYYGDGYGDGYHNRQEQGALDLDLSPADTQVYLNGQYVGVVDDFDGWPQYLWLDPGTYDIVFYREGYKTLARQVTIYRGLVIDWDDKLEHGPSIRPEDLPSASHERRDARVEQDREMREKAERSEHMPPPPPPPPGASNNWRDRVRGDRERHNNSDYRDESRAGRLHLSINPPDASVYLDGRFLGTGDDVARMSSGLLIDAGQHKLSVVRPGRHAEERQFEIKAGEPLDLRIDLQGE